LTEGNTTSRYLVEFALHVTGPIKLEMMTPQVEKFGVYRFRLDPGKEFFYLERHKKSVQTATGTNSTER